ncbi:MAG TPA: hypothetical protein VFT49_03320 [Candidatus Saccharimonadales bacterium]|nr:hypothetical protein [Candidatus Saccharimonadales bacterium]
MSFIRKSLVASFTSLLTLTLLSLAISIGINHTAGNSANVKKALADSGIYKTIVPNALAQTQSISTSVGNIPLNDPQIKSAAESSLTPTEVQGDADKIIDSIYAWLNGKTQTPNFNISLAGPKDKLANNISLVIEQRAATLPTCTSLSRISTDVINASCLPPGVSPLQIATQVKSQIANNQDYLGQSDVTASSVKSSNSNQSIFSDQLRNLPNRYQHFKKAPYYLAALVILLAIAIVMLSSTRGRGLRRVGLALAVAGILTLAFGWGFDEVVKKAVVPNIKISNNVTQTEVRSVITDLTHPIDKSFVVCGTVYLLLALVFIFSENIFTWISNRSGSKAAAMNKNSQSEARRQLNP